jgi:hypothetical protein
VPRHFQGCPSAGSLCSAGEDIVNTSPPS